MTSEMSYSYRSLGLSLRRITDKNLASLKKIASSLRWSKHTLRDGGAVCDFSEVRQYLEPGGGVEKIFERLDGALVLKINGRMYFEGRP